MIEIRPIREAEAERFLGLLCEVFDLDYARAEAIFFTEPLFDLSRKWALIENGELVSILTTVPLEFGWGRAIGIAGVATRRSRQGHGLGSKLIRRVMEESARVGEHSVFLFAQDTRLYEKVGFVAIDTVIRGRILAKTEREIPPSLEVETVRYLYDEWTSRDPNRLRRDDLRWSYWKWNLRVCNALGQGYLCFEAGIVREVVADSVHEWELPPESEWFGLTSMARQLGVHLEAETVELHLMAHNPQGVPQFFMTDQF